LGDSCDACPYDSLNDVDEDGLCADVDPCPFDPLNDVDGDSVCGDEDNCEWVYNPGQEDADSNGVGDACQNNTPAGTGVVVELGPVVLTFTRVDSVGFTNLTMHSIPYEPPLEDYIPVPWCPSQYYEITTDAQYSGEIDIGLHYDSPFGINLPELDFELMRLDGQDWLSVGDSVDSLSDTIYAVAESLGTFQLYVKMTRCGDSDANGIINISDAVLLVAFIFGGGPAPVPYLNGNPDCNTFINVSDAVHLVTYIFGGGPEPCQQPSGCAWECEVGATPLVE
jgi:hypothetical protein